MLKKKRRKTVLTSKTTIGPGRHYFFGLLKRKSEKLQGRGARFRDAPPARDSNMPPRATAPLVVLLIIRIYIRIRIRIKPICIRYIFHLQCRGGLETSNHFLYQDDILDNISFGLRCFIGKICRKFYRKPGTLFPHNACGILCYLLRDLPRNKTI